MWRWIILSTLSVQFLYISPFFVGTLIDELAFTPSQAGFISGSELVATAIASALIFFLIDRLNWQKVIFICSISSAFSIYLCIGVDNYSSILALRVIASFCAGSLYSLAFALLGRSKQPERNFGWSMTMQSILAAVYLLSLPSFIKQWGITSIYYLEMGTILCCVVLALKLHQEACGVTDNKIVRNKLVVLTPLIGLVFFSIAQGALWAFVERIGNTVNIEAEFIGITLTVATILGIFGGLSSAIQSKHFGHKKPLTFVFIGQALTIWLLWVSPSPFIYLISISVFNFLWIYAIAFQLGIVAALDSSGKSCALATTFQALGLAIGAVVAGSLLELHGNFDMVYMAILISSAISLYLMMKKPAPSETNA